MAAQRLAKEDGVSLNQWIAVAAAEKVGCQKLRPIFSKDELERQLVKGLWGFFAGRPSPGQNRKIALDL